MWPFGLSRQEMEHFLMEYYEEFIDVLLKAYGLYVDEIIMDHFQEEAAEWARDYGEVC